MFARGSFHMRNTVKSVIGLAYSNLRGLWYFGLNFVCPCCNGRFRKLLPAGVKPGRAARCPRCDSLERHRLLWIYLRDKTTFFEEHLKVLDIAPMRFFQNKCKSLKNIDYISADISSPLAMLKIDITNIPLPDNHFDCVLCSHVLEHVLDDQKAMCELFRILKPGGWAILNSPVDLNRDKTFENPNVVLPEERESVFGQMDHVRIYGKDYKNRLEHVGFVVKVDDYAGLLADDVANKYGLMKNESIYLCTKP